MVLIVDNYDSFTYNLYQLIGSVTADICVIRNDAMTVEGILGLQPTHIFLSPGPGRPAQAGVTEALVQSCKGEIPVLGICLGHQAICEVFGAEIGFARHLMHGKQSEIKLDTTVRLFQGMQPQMRAARYHSLIAERETLPGTLRVIATDTNGEIMAVQAVGYEIYGVQFHPESILTPDGAKIIRNFLK